MIKIFTPTFADSSNNNAQNLTVKSIVSRLDPGVFDILMLSESDNIDSRLVNRKNFHYIKLGSHNRTLKIIAYLIKYRPHIYFYPTFTHIDQIFLHLKSYLNSNMSIVTHIVHTVDENHESAMTPHSKKLREILAASDFIAGNSNYVSHTVERFMKHKSSTIHNGIECEIFYPDNPRSYQGPKKVLYAGSFQSRKRPDVVIEIANRFPDSDILL